MADTASICLAWASLGGTVSSAAANVVAYAGHRAEQRGEDPGTAQSNGLFALYILLSIGGIVCFVVATKFGPVALAMPVQTAATLLSTMVFQAVLGIKSYTKPMRAGTVVLAAAACCLMAVGPTSANNMNVLALVEKPIAVTWLCASLAALVLGLIAVKKGNLKGNVQMAAFALVVADSTAIGATVGKMMTVAGGAEFAVFFVIYMTLGIISLLVGAGASAACDQAIFLPVAQCMQLLINAFTGLAVWGDAERLPAPVAYLMVYILICTGVYLLSAFDVADTMARLTTLKHTMPRIHARSNFYTTTELADPFWRKLNDAELSWDKRDAAGRASDLCKACAVGLEFGKLSGKQVTELVSALVAAFDKEEQSDSSRTLQIVQLWADGVKQVAPASSPLGRVEQRTMAV